MSPTEGRVNALEEELRRKIEVETGFADQEVQRDTLQKIFNRFDSDGSGTLDYDEFFHAMTRLNFIGVQQEIEALFDRFDENLDGTINYVEFANYLYGSACIPEDYARAKNCVQRVKETILSRGGKNGIRSLLHILRRMDTDKSGSLDSEEFEEGLIQYGIQLTKLEMEQVMTYFDVDGSGRISFNELLRGLRGNMSKRRILLVKEVYGRLDVTGDGIVSVEDFLRLYDAHHHPAVVAGEMSVNQAIEDFMSNFEGTGEGRGDGLITWREFLSYYKDLSAGIGSDDEFELTLRNAWHISGGSGWCANSTCRRVLVTHKDGSQEVYELKNDLGLDTKDLRVVKETLRMQGVRAIAQVSLS